ncbi:hypothetical protein BELL_0983g00040 [Botrytis elliptica]|uniref:Uncharacterized protein n=1 Tax=Botrytis elliptica TaxID=278938 RepID=A0A4Z1IX39_9HELO|nr:hypothetical protein BELL_0983g00040 [Botrytis elliptica]
MGWNRGGRERGSDNKKVHERDPWIKALNFGMKAVRLLLQTISTSPHLNLPHSPYHDLCANPLADFRTV